MDGGLTIFWDFVSGIPSKFKHCQLVYGLYEHGEERLEPKLVPKVPLELDAYKSTLSKAVFGTEHEVKRLVSSPAINLIVEVQLISDKTIQFGWSVIEVFTAQRQLNEGLWKLPVFRPPTNLTIELRDFKRQVPVPNAFIFGRIAVPGSKILQLGVNPDKTSEFFVPQSHNPAATPPMSRNPIGDSFLPPRSGGYGVNPMANSGIAIRIERLIGVLSKSHLKFQVAIQQETRTALDRQGNKCSWVSEPVNAFGLEMNTGKSRRIPGTQIRADKAELRPSDIDSIARQSAGTM